MDPENPCQEHMTESAGRPLVVKAVLIDRMQLLERSCNILYTICYILYTTYYILYTIYYILYTIYFTILLVLTGL